MLIIGFISQKEEDEDEKLFLFVILAMIKMWLGQILRSLNTKNNNVGWSLTLRQSMKIFLSEQVQERLSKILFKLFFEMF